MTPKSPLPKQQLNETYIHHISAPRHRDRDCLLEGY